VPELRLDAALAARGLAKSRTTAARLIADGLVTVDGRPTTKAALKVSDGQEISVASSDHYVSRAAHKLITALDAFGVDPEGRLALDVGASTGGFTQVLLERGARQVIALDVGHGQLHPSIRSDPRVVVVEGFNARSMTPDSLASASRVPERATLAVADLSFISLTMVLPAILETADVGADVVALVKPQFEVGRGGIREGVVRDPGRRADAVMTVLWSAWDLGLGTAGFISSPVLGGSGNHEYLVHLTATGGRNPTEWMQQVSSSTS
jgi:23S rRNA (cytidine1920-2'-O)/16S rRNA (cytidine1409-2'-O)-methyltransferase